MPPADKWGQRTSGELLAELSDHAFFQYERTLQKEAEPELAVTLPPSLLQEGGSSPDVLFAGTATARVLTVAVNYQVCRPESGFCFNGPFAYTDGEVKPTAMK